MIRDSQTVVTLSDYRPAKIGKGVVSVGTLIAFSGEHLKLSRGKGPKLKPLMLKFLTNASA